MAKRDRQEAKAEGHQPFRGLASLVQKAGISVEPREAQPVVEGEDEEQVFSRAMEGIARASWRHERVVGREPAAPPAPDPQLEDLRLMQDALEGRPAPEVLDHPEYIEGWIGVAGKRYLPHLRNGVYSIQGQLDLHGLTRDEARQAVDEYLRKMSAARPCCVKIIHGRGINSPKDQAVLKESLQRWLSSRRMSRHVVAYASAPFADGGVGAVYILLRGPR